MTRTIVTADPTKNEKAVATSGTSGSQETKKSEAGSMRIGGEILAGLLGIAAVL